MPLDNETYVTTLEKFEYGQQIREGKKILQNNPKKMLAGGHFIFAKVKSEVLDVGEFSIGTRFGEGTIALDSRILSAGESLAIPLEEQLDIRTYQARLARAYTYPKGQFQLLTTEKMLYVIQEFSDDRKFIQWAIHNHNGKKQQIIENADYALFTDTSTPPSLAALVSGLDMLLMGDSVIAAVGYYQGAVVNRN